MPSIRTNVCCFCAVLAILHTAGAAELRVVGFHHNTLALARVDSAAVAAGDVYVVLEFEDRWFREIGRARVTKVLQSGVVAEVISSPKPPSEWYNKVAIPETAWDADTYQQWQRSSGRTGPLPRIGSGVRPDADPVRPRVRGSRPAAGTPHATRPAGSTRPLIWDRVGWIKWMMYGIGAGSGAAAFYLHRQAQDALKAVSPGNPPGVNAHYQRDADEYQKFRNVTGWVSFGTLAGGLVLHEWELSDRSRQPATARLESQCSAGLATVGCRVQW